jgi:hypothetical protein
VELGNGFTFVGRQYRINVGGTHYRVDLVFYHRILRCFVLIDLKLGEVQHRDIGQMNLYMGYFAAEENTEGDNPPIGIIICREKNKTVVEYALRTASRPIGVASYTVSSELPAAYRDDLPSPEQIAERLKLWDPKEVDE